MRGALGGGGQGAGDAGGFAHGDGVAGHAVARMGDEVAADATARHHQSVDVAGDQGAEGDVVRLHLHARVGIGRLLVLFGREGVDVYGEGRADHGVFLTATLDQVFLGHQVTSLDATAIAHADLGRRRDDLSTGPGAAGFAQLADDVIDLGAGAHGRLGHLGGVGGVDAVLVVGHEQDEVILDREQRSLAVARRHAGGLERRLELIRADMASVTADRVQLVGQRLGVVDRHQGVEGHRLARTGLLTTDLEFAAGAGAEVTVAGRVDEHRGGPGLAAGLRLRDDRLERAPFAVGGHDARVQLDLDARGDAKLFKDQLHFFRVVGHSVDPVAIDRVTLAQSTDQLLVEARLVEIEEVAEERRGPDTAEGTMGFKESNLRASAGGGDRGGDSGRSSAADDDVAVGGQGDVSLRFGEHARLGRGRGSLGERSKGAKAEQGRSQEATTGGGLVHLDRLGRIWPKPTKSPSDEGLRG